MVQNLPIVTLALTDVSTTVCLHHKTRNQQRDE
jgi:hypothetical protein